MTNFERIKAMSVEQMAGFLRNVSSVVPCYQCFIKKDCAGFSQQDCLVGIKAWLQQEADAND